MFRSLAFSVFLAVARTGVAQVGLPPDSVPVVPSIDDAELDTKGIPTVEVLPEYPGGQEELARFIRNEVTYPKKARRTGIEGKVVVRFVVDKDGRVTDVTVAKSVDPLLDAEAVRAVQAMPPWTPGTMNGKPVKVMYNLPVLFKLKG